MKAVVVYESLWGNTAAVAWAIAEGLGPDTVVLSTAEATPEALAEVDLLVVGAPVHGFTVPTAQSLENIKANAAKAPTPPDLSQPAMRSWLESLSPGKGRAAAFDTRVRGPFGSGAGRIEKALAAAGYRPLAKARGFIVQGRYGPLREGELERAQAWGAELARLMR
ncbi:MAG: flavodoxin family protein [Thermoleophilia bacterium]|nr:flavodoxin family protein [Thermoleophilia bacterium]